MFETFIQGRRASDFNELLFADFFISELERYFYETNECQRELNLLFIRDRNHFIFAHSVISNQNVVRFVKHERGECYP